MALCLIAMAWSNPLLWLAIFEVTLGLGFVIFVHELGHFAVAKLCGVKVEKFYLGFDIAGLRLCRFRWGETEYGIGILPLGGYVKMLGQEDNPARLREEIERAKLPAAAGQAEAASAGDESRKEKEAAPEPAQPQRPLFDPRSYLAKSVPRRMAIISAGVIMNLIFGEVLAVIAFGPGVWMASPTVGQVAPGGGAWQAGLRPGDEVLEVGGRKIRNFRDMQEAVMLGDVANGVSMLIQRPGQQEPLLLDVSTHPIAGHPGIGILSSAEPILLKDADKLPFRPGTPAATARPAFRRGDRIVRLDNQPIHDCAEIHAYLNLHVDRPIEVTVERAARPSGERRAEATIRLGLNPMRQLGLRMEMGEITAVQKDSPAEKAGLQPGDVLRQIDGRPIADPLTFSDDELHWDKPPRDRVDAEPLTFSDDELRRWARQTVTLGVTGRQRQGMVPIVVTLRGCDRYAPPLMPGDPVDVPPLGVAYQVLNTVRGVQPEGPAAQAGVRPGDVIESVALKPPPRATLETLRKRFACPELDQPEGKPLELGKDKLNWPYFLFALQFALPGTTVEVHWSHEGQAAKATLQPQPAATWFNADRGWLFEAKSFLQRAEGFRDAVRLGTEETVNATLVVYHTLTAIGSGRVSARNLGGPKTIAEAAFYEAMRGPGNLFLFLTLLSANLAVINFLPIPLLDGGLFILLLYEGIRGKPADERVQEVLTYIGLAFILGLMIFVIGLDFHLIPRPG